MAVPLGIRGGFTATSRGLFIGLAAVSVAAVLVADERSFRRSIREPAILSLLGLGLLALLSAVWTTGDAGDAARWGLVIAAYAATALVAAHAAREQGVAAVAVMLCALAGLDAAIGLVAAGLRVEPYAERIGGSWRPGGTLEYPPALALIQVFALPALLRGMLGGFRPARLAAAGGVALAAGAIALADSRAEIALAVVVLGLAVAWPSRTVRAGRAGALLAGLVALGAALAVRLALGGYAFPGATGGDLGRLLLLAAVVAGTVVVWGVVGRLRERDRPIVPARSVVPALAVIAVLALGTMAGLSIAQRTSGPWTEPSSGFAHGREDQWRAAIDTALDHPVLGVGADAYLRGSAAEQGSEVSRYAHDLPLEAWAELGPLGFALVLALGLFTGMIVWRIRSDPRAWLVAPAAAAFLLANLVDWPWHLAGVGALWAAALGACIAIDRG